MLSVTFSDNHWEISVLTPPLDHQVISGFSTTAVYMQLKNKMIIYFYILDISIMKAISHISRKVAYIEIENLLF